MYAICSGIINVIGVEGESVRNDVIKESLARS